MMETLRHRSPRILVAGSHDKIIQSILDFDFASGKEAPSVIACISAGRKSLKLFWGDSEILLPVVASIDDESLHDAAPDFLLNITSARGAKASLEKFFARFPTALGAHIFAENVAERDALSLVTSYGQSSGTPRLIAGPSGVGLCIPGILKLGAIGGVSGERLAQLGTTRGEVAIVCSSGGMVNELMYQVVAGGAGVSFAVAYGGDRFPITSPLEWLQEAELDPATKATVYFGELGGQDEYDLIAAIKRQELTKPIYAYIAGRYVSTGTPIQFGHAKALAKQQDETAVAKTSALGAAGVHTSDSYETFLASFASLPDGTTTVPTARTWTSRAESVTHTKFTSPKVPAPAAGTSFTENILRRLLLRERISPALVAFTDQVFSELIDHGPHVSGAVNTMITTRAGRDMMSSLATGILTIGDRFGGALNSAATVWHHSVRAGVGADALVLESSQKKEPIPGIGHLKYNVYRPDPRIETITTIAKQDLARHSHLSFAESIAALTTRKKSNLILNVDGAVAAIFLDYLQEHEQFTSTQIEELLNTGFFNALFVIPRSIGFIGHHLDQKRLDEGLFRLQDSDVFEW